MDIDVNLIMNLIALAMHKAAQNAIWGLSEQWGLEGPIKYWLGA